MQIKFLILIMMKLNLKLLMVLMETNMQQTQLNNLDSNIIDLLIDKNIIWIYKSSEMKFLIDKPVIKKNLYKRVHIQQQHRNFIHQQMKKIKING